MLAAQKLYISVDDYLETEQLSPIKSEFYPREIVDMPGAIPVHNRIVGNFSTSIGVFLNGKICQFFPSDLKIFVEKYPYFTYTDLTIVCEKLEFHVNDDNTLLNPKVIIEVLSKSNANYDRSGKFGLYRALPSLEEYILISSFSHEAVVYHKHEDNVWGVTAKENKLSSSVYIKTIDMFLLMNDIYYNTILEKEDLKLI